MASDPVCAYEQEYVAVEEHVGGEFLEPAVRTCLTLSAGHEDAGYGGVVPERVQGADGAVVGE